MQQMIYIQRDTRKKVHTKECPNCGKECVCRNNNMKRHRAAAQTSYVATQLQSFTKMAQLFEALKLFQL